MKSKFSMMLLVALVFAVPSASFATRYWTGVLTTWDLALNNGVAYVSSPQMPLHCTYSRAQIEMSGTNFDKAQYAYALAAKAKNKQLTVVVDDTQTVCVISGMAETG